VAVGVEVGAGGGDVVLVRLLTQALSMNREMMSGIIVSDSRDELADIFGLYTFRGRTIGFKNTLCAENIPQQRAGRRSKASDWYLWNMLRD
jgi:hypothetical protein